LLKRSIDENLSVSDNNIKRLRRQWSVVYVFQFFFFSPIQPMFLSNQQW
jgi:hypothetical protein